MVISLEGLIHPIMGSHAYVYVYGHNRIPKIIRAPEGNWGEGIQPYQAGPRAVGGGERARTTAGVEYMRE